MRRDPVCGKEVDPLRARAVGIWGGRTYYFCSPEHRAAFARDPSSHDGRYAGPNVEERTAEPRKSTPSYGSIPRRSQAASSPPPPSPASGNTPPSAEAREAALPLVMLAIEESGPLPARRPLPWRWMALFAAVLIATTALLVLK